MAKTKETSTTASVDLTKALIHGSSGIKKKIRDISRVLNRDNLSADVKIANERALKTLKIELEKVQDDLRTKKIAQRYHKVRFFEKKKAIRFYKQSEKNIKELEESEEDDKEIKKKLKKEKRVFEHCKIDLAYVLNFPKNEKYISLYAKAEVNESLPKRAKDGIKKTNAKREQYKKSFAEQMKNGKLEVSLEEGINGEITGDKKRRGVNNNKGKAQQVDDVVVGDKEENGDDFFE